jgi:hypothetical protein
MAWQKLLQCFDLIRQRLLGIGSADVVSVFFFLDSLDSKIQICQCTDFSNVIDVRLTKLAGWPDRSG